MKAFALRFHAAVRELEPEQAVLTLAVGLVLGVFPVVGCPTVLCLLAAAGLRLNPAALQLVNQVSSPLQFVLLLPLARVGAWLCGATSGDASTVHNLPLAALHAVAGWLCTCVPLGVLLYVVLLLVMRKSRFSWSNGVKSPA